MCACVRQSVWACFIFFCLAWNWYMTESYIRRSHTGHPGSCCECVMCCGSIRLDVPWKFYFRDFVHMQPMTGANLSSILFAPQTMDYTPAFPHTRMRAHTVWQVVARGQSYLMKMLYKVKFVHDCIPWTHTRTWQVLGKFLAFVWQPDILDNLVNLCFHFLSASSL